MWPYWRLSVAGLIFVYVQPTACFGLHHIQDLLFDDLAPTMSVSTIHNICASYPLSRENEGEIPR